jgi:ATP-binding cassette subfamily F protein uup
MSIINGLEESDTSQVVLRKGIKWHFVSKQQFAGELTIEESILPLIMRR